MSRPLFTKQQQEWLIEAHKLHRIVDIPELFNERFGTSFVYSQFRQWFCKHHGLDRNVGFYTDQQIEWLRENVNNYDDLHDMHKDFIARFREKSFTGMRKAMKDNGIWREKSMMIQARSKSLSHMSIGDTYVDYYGNVIVKVADVIGDSRGNFKHRSHIVWKQHNGEIPQGYKITHIDGNNANDDIENLCLMNQGEIGTMCKRRWMRKGIITECGIAQVRLENALKKGQSNE